MLDDLLDNFLRIWEDLGNFCEALIKGFNNFTSYLLQNGNCVLFLVFLIMGIILLFNAKEIEEHQKLYARNLEYIKKKGRAGTTICILIAIGFLSRGLLVFLDLCFSSLPIPIFFSYEPFRKFYVAATSVEAISDFSLYISFFYFISTIFSLLSLVCIAIGIYLAIFNKRILRTKFRSHRMILLGIGLAFIFGIPTSIRLMV